jgi:hypothetical protein
MEGRSMSRRGLFKTLVATAIGARMVPPAVGAELSLPMNLPETKFTFDDKGIEGPARRPEHASSCSARRRTTSTSSWRRLARSPTST